MARTSTFLTKDYQPLREIQQIKLLFWSPSKL